MHQVVIIHGGDSFSSRQKFFRALKRRPVTLDTFQPGRPGWKTAMPKALGPKYQVLLPQMPNKFNAEYAAWNIWFTKLLPFIKNNTILIGHSLGGLFLVKYLSENRFPRKIKSLILIAAPDNQVRGIGNFKITNSLHTVAKRCSSIYLWYSRDDRIVPIKIINYYQSVWPLAKIRVFNRHGHFNQPKFPELITLVRSLTE